MASKERREDVQSVLDEPYGREVTPTVEIGAGRETKRGRRTHPSFLTMVYLPSLNGSDSLTWR